MTLCDVAQGTGRAQIRNGVALVVSQHVVGHRDQRVFLTEHAAVLADESQTVDIGVNDDAEVKTLLRRADRVFIGTHLVHDALQILLQGLGVVGELSCALAVQNLVVDAQCLEQLGQDDAANGVDGVGTDAELAGLDSLDISQTEVEHRLHMTLVHGVVPHDAAQLLDGCIVEVLSLSNAQHLCAVGSRQELAIAVEQLQGVPLRGVMRCGDDDAAVGLVPAYGQLCGRCRGQPDVDDFVAHADECAADDVAHHGSADTSVASDDNLLATDECGVGRCKLHDVQRIERVARLSADGTTNTRD